ncbi:MAG: gas vesicle protein [Solirubrobacteraceae bacterium]
MAEKRSNTRKNGRKEPAELARAAVTTVAQLTGRQPETVLGLRKAEDGWQVVVEVLEMRRVPNSTDLLGCYVVNLDDDGEVMGYERRRRYQRGQTGGDEQ